MTYTLAHISDIHLSPLPAIRRRDLMSKRITGYVNWRRHRIHALGNTTLGAVVDAMLAAKPDHVAVTGDLTNLALKEELSTAALWLEELGDPATVTAVPGNHDAYVRGAVAKAMKTWAPWMTDDTGRAPKSNQDYPFVRRRGPVAIIGVSSAIATPPLVAAGWVGSGQAARLTAMLEETGREGLFRVVLIHHPPVRGAAKLSKRLFGLGRFQSVIAKVGAELVLHGHTHLSQRTTIKGKGNTIVPVIGVPSASQAPGGNRPAGAFNLFRIGGAAPAWSVDLEEWSATANGGVHLTEMRSLTTTETQGSSASRK